MKKHKHNSLLILIFMALFVSLLLAGCAEESDPAPIMFKLADKVPKKFPADVTIDYFVSADSLDLVNDDHYMVFKSIREGRYHDYSIYPAKLTDEGYTIPNTKYKSYAIPNPVDFGFSEPFPIEKRNGQIQLHFNSESEYHDFFDDYSNPEIAGFFYGVKEFVQFYTSKPNQDSEKQKE